MSNESIILKNIKTGSMNRNDILSMYPVEMEAEINDVVDSMLSTGKIWYKEDMDVIVIKEVK